MRRLPLALIAAGYTILAACGETTVVAPRESTAAPAAALLSRGGSKKQHEDFNITSGGNTVSLFGFATLSFSKNSVCDPDSPATVSGYAHGTATGDWSAPCPTLSKSIKITATLIEAPDGSYIIDFSPDLRFGPNATVTLSTDIFRSLIKSKTRPAGYYSVGMPFFDGSQVQRKAANDPHENVVNYASGVVSRRVFHFSGYSVITGDRCNDHEDPDCVFLDDDSR